MKLNYFVNNIFNTCACQWIYTLLIRFSLLFAVFLSFFLFSFNYKSIWIKILSIKNDRFYFHFALKCYDFFPFNLRLKMIMKCWPFKMRMCRVCVCVCMSVYWLLASPLNRAINDTKVIPFGLRVRYVTDQYLYIYTHARTHKHILEWR